MSSDDLVAPAQFQAAVEGARASRMAIEDLQRAEQLEIEALGLIIQLAKLLRSHANYAAADAVGRLQQALTEALSTPNIDIAAMEALLAGLTGQQPVDREPPAAPSMTVLRVFRTILKNGTADGDVDAGFAAERSNITARSVKRTLEILAKARAARDGFHVHSSTAVFLDDTSLRNPEVWAALVHGARRAEYIKSGVANALLSPVSGTE